MKKKLLLSVMAAAILSSSITVCAAPQYMADGAVFDPEWYLDQNPDIASWPLGTSADALYQHYVTHGVEEGRAPYDALTLDMAGILPYQGTDGETVQQSTDTAQPVVPEAGQEQTAASSQLPVVLMRDGKQLTDENTIMAVEGESYALAWEYGTRYDSQKLTPSVKDDLVSVTFRCIPRESMDTVAKEQLDPYTLPGYEWREVQAAFAFDPKLRNLLANPELYADGIINWDDSTSVRTMRFAYTPGCNIHQLAGFTVNCNGVDYPGCAFCTTDNVVGWEGTTMQLFVLVPEGYSGKMSIILRGYREKIRFDF